MGNALAVQLYPPLTSTWPPQVAGIKLLNGFLNGLSWPMAQFVIAVATPREIRARGGTAIYFFSGSLASLLGNYVYAYTINLGLGGQMWISSVFFLLTGGMIMVVSYLLLYERITPKRPKSSGGEGAGPRSGEDPNHRLADGGYSGVHLRRDNLRLRLRGPGGWARPEPQPSSAGLVFYHRS